MKRSVICPSRLTCKARQVAERNSAKATGHASGGPNERLAAAELERYKELRHLGLGESIARAKVIAERKEEDMPF